ncbi:MAG: LysR family transcriptional regulator [Sulfobacillus thermosulfidooxidans]|uniref:LysR family transcriptional regulator n=1 Tax=Sulfobacillus thermosulfidooxidans TaxID=28034 RepID=A0A2T2X020_SULTH|nr:MAG: LysR family transcriptional regulator [Sulfobacillus thermosulfidooxidans]
MELKQLEYFVAVADHKSITKGAASLYVSQPTISQQIKLLEEELGHPLFIRHAQGVELTDDGATLLRYALRVLQNVDDAKAEIQGAASSHGTIAIGVLPTLTRSILPTVIRQYQRIHGDIQFAVTEGSSQRLLKSITAGDLHLALVDLPLSDPLLAVETLWTEELILITPHAMPMPPGPLALEQVRHLPFITMEPGYGLRDALFRMAQARGFNPHIVHELTSIGAIIGFVEHGFGISVVPERTVELEIQSRRIGFVRLAQSNTRDIGMIWRAHRRLPDPVQTFLAFLRTYGWQSK